MNGIKMKDCRFYVDETARTVVCVIPPVITNKLGGQHKTSDMVFDFIRENFQFSDIDMYDAITFWNKNFSKALTMPHSFIGKAVCAPEDEWDEELGRMLAFSRAKDKCYKSFFKRANMFVQAVDCRLGNMIEAFNDFGMKLENKRDALQQQIDERMPSADASEEE